MRRLLIDIGRFALNCADMEPLVATFSIAARDPETGALGVAVASKFLAVGAYVPYVKAGVGAVATQARTNLSYGPDVLELLANAQEPAAASAAVRSADEHVSVRQLGIVAADGSSHSFTGSDCTAWAGGIAAPGLAAQGNILAGEHVLDALVTVWHSQAGLPFPERLLAALAAAEQAGGDSRGRQAAALLAEPVNGRRLDLRIDDHSEPVDELKRLLTHWRSAFD